MVVKKLVSKNNFMKKRVIQIIYTTLFAHSFCCVLPIICFFIGLTSIGEYLTIFHEYEWVFITLNLLAIVGGFFLFQIHKTKSSCTHDNCNHLSKKSYWIITSISIFLIIVPHLIN